MSRRGRMETLGENNEWGEKRMICSGQLDVEKDHVTLSVFCEGSHSPESREIRVDTSPSAQYDMVFNIILTTTEKRMIDR
ncbi:hypothetical protein QUF63_13860 [Anaerolineales bacterium HSG25]|nr:hypothetical protein [Anaerolineales bacterium HSG25]